MRWFKMLIIVCMISALVIGPIPGQASAANLPGVANLKAVVSDDGYITLTWDPPFMMSASAIDSYDIRVQYNDQNYNFYNQDLPDCTWGYTPLLGPGLILIHVSYEIDDNGSNPVTVRAEYFAPPSPSGLQFSEVTWNGVNLKWEDKSNYETAWFVDITGQSYDHIPLHEQIKLEPNDNQYVEAFFSGASSPLAQGGYYTFKVWAQTGPFVGTSAQVSTRIPMCPPTQLMADSRTWDTGPGVELTWKNNSRWEDKIEIERTNPDGTKKYILVDDDEESYHDQNLGYFSKYTYRVRATSTVPGVSSEWSDPVSVITPRLPVEDSISNQNLSSDTAHPIKMQINGRLLDTDVDPLILEGRTMVPIRAILSALGATLDWNQEDQTILINKGAYSVKMQIGNKRAFVNGKEVEMDAPPRIINGRTMGPVRFIAENFGCDVQWDRDQRLITIAGLADGDATNGENQENGQSGQSIKNNNLIEMPKNTISQDNDETSIAIPIKKYVITLEPAQITLDANHSVTFEGYLKCGLTASSAITPAAGKEVTLFNAEGTARTSIGKAQTNSQGMYSFKYVPPESGTFIAVYQNDDGEDLAVSSTSTVTVKKAIVIPGKIPAIRTLP